ncbi:MAG: hypothetical protein JWM80_745 [Cyanobacteria bacterium RYN_339]|nr:hypothetical protein [Cyanobacteria bacterium RYN_339]
MNSSTSASKLVLALALAGFLFVLANMLVAWRMPALLANSPLFDAFELERRVAACPAKGQVRVVVLGNSHGLAGMRPDLLARHLGVPAATIFNLCLKGANARETLMIARRFLPQFPAAAVAPIFVDELLVGQAWAEEPRMRYRSRFDVAERLAMLPWHDDTDRRFGLLVGAAVPMFDQGELLRTALGSQPRRFLVALATGEAALTPGSPNALVHAAPYAWGFPPVWDVPGFFGASRLAAPFTPGGVRQRALQITRQLEKAPLGFDDLEACCAYLEARGVRPLLVQTPIYDGLSQRLRQPPFAQAEAAYLAALGGFLTTTRRTVRNRPGTMPRALFFDEDHLNRAGADAFTRWLAGQL